MKDLENPRPFPHFKAQPHAISAILRLLHFVTSCYTKIFLFSFLLISRASDWPALHGNPEHTGRSEEQLQFPLTLQWAVEFENERIATSAEPLTWDRRVFVPTLAGVAHALDAITGEPIATIQPASNGQILSYPTDLHAGRQGVLSAFVQGRKIELWKSSTPIRQN